MEVLQSIGFDWQVALANFINFLIIFFILKRYVFGPVGHIINQRKKLIDDGVNMAQQSETELLVAQQKAEEEIKNAKKEANAIIAKAKESGDDLIARAETEASEKADQAMTQANKNIEKRKEQVEKELLEKTAGLVATGVAKILNEDIDETRNHNISKRALEHLNQS